ncbi:MAG: hypothetical protein ISS65_02620 [Desulfobacterales bacterium]|uniref:Mut7-C RNAse domain-containing protein n=1 Tax=Candidatus Desulfatibia profunda TaxID=2841695 RepID=A0A8J6NR91_9BACT|nr:hypothetical protein [Candidatus Desulfatibia profunda]MBL7179089.1 hypothetical protein [Desulfobacterales bacterium]
MKNENRNARFPWKAHLRLKTSLYRSDYKKDDIVELSLVENRTILTRSRDLLSIKGVVRGYLVKQSNPAEQFKEVINHFDLKLNIPST